MAPLRFELTAKSVGAVALAIALATALILIVTASGRKFDQAHVAAGQALYAAHCANCHGPNLEGQPDWRKPMANGRMPAPPHDASGHTWHHADDVLFGVTKFGLKPYVGEDYESDMPAFADKLSETEIAAVWAYIKSTWPERERTHQQQITSQSPGKKP